MSAFMCSNEHLNLMAEAAYVLNRHIHTFAKWECNTPSDPMLYERIGQVLHAANVKSLRDRYGDRDVSAPFEWKRTGAPLTEKTLSDKAVMLLKLTHCYVYQACDGHDWETSDAKKICELLEAHLVRALPGYDAAPWGL